MDRSEERSARQAGRGALVCTPTGSGRDDTPGDEAALDRLHRTVNQASGDATSGIRVAG